MPPLVFRDVSRELAQPALRDLLALSIGSPTPERLAADARDYALRPERGALAYFEGSEPLGVIGWERRAGDPAKIWHLAVVENRRREGIGRSLIHATLKRIEALELQLETDASAVAFYKRCGFSVRSLGEKYPGVERFECILRMERDALADGRWILRSPDGNRRM